MSCSSKTHSLVFGRVAYFRFQITLTRFEHDGNMETRVSLICIKI